MLINKKMFGCFKNDVVNDIDNDCEKCNEWDMIDVNDNCKTDNVDDNKILALFYEICETKTPQEVEDFLKLYKLDKQDLDDGLTHAANNFNLDVITTLLSNGATNFQNLLNGACFFNNIELVTILLRCCSSTSDISQADIDPLNALCVAIQFERNQIVQMFLDADSSCINDALGAACMLGKMDCVLFLIQKGATDWDIGLLKAVEGGFLNIVKLMVNNGATNISEAFEESVLRKHYEIIYYFIENFKVEINLLDSETILILLNLGMDFRKLGSRVHYFVEKRKNRLHELLSVISTHIFHDIIYYVLFDFVEYIE